MLRSHFRQQCIFLREILYSLFFIGESLTAVETARQKIKDAAFLARSNRGLIFFLHPPPPPQAFFPFSLSLFPVSYTISPFIFSPFRQIKRALSEQKAGFFSSAVSCVCGGGGGGKKTAFSKQFSRKISAAFVCANIFGRGLQYIPPQKWPLYIGGSGAEKQREALKFLARKAFFLPKGELANTLYKAPLFPTPYKLPPPPPPPLP